MSVWVNSSDEAYLRPDGGWAFDWVIRSQTEVEWDDFRQFVEHRAGQMVVAQHKHLVKMWNFARPAPDPVYSTNKKTGAQELKRTKELFDHNFTGLTVLALDFEHPDYSVEQFAAEHADLEWVLHTTYSNRLPAKAHAECFRVLLRLEGDFIPFRELDPATYERGSRLEALQKRWPYVDVTCFEKCRGIFLPAIPPGGQTHFKCRSNSGQPFKWSELPVSPPLTRAPKPQHQLSADGSGPVDLWTFDLHQYFSDRHLIRAEETPTKLIVQCPNHQQHSGKADTAKLLFIDDRWEFKCHHGHCSPGGSTWVKQLLASQLGPDGVRPYCLVRDFSSTLHGFRVRKGKVAPEEPPAPKPKLPLFVEEEEEPTPIFRFEERYLPRELPKFIPEVGFIAVRSPKGTGKTEQLLELRRRCEANQQSVLLLGHRIHLLRNLSERLDLDNYQDERGLTDGLALCVNSLKRFQPGFHAPYHTVLIDECEQFFTHLASNTLRADIGPVFRSLEYVLRHAKRLVLLDADLSAELSLEAVGLFNPQCLKAGVFGVLNSYRALEGTTTQMFESEPHLAADLVRSVAAGRKCFVASNWRGTVTTLSKLLADQPTPPQQLLITAHTTEDPAVQAFIRDPNREAKKYQVVLASPTLGTGVSIDALPNGLPAFAVTYGFFGQRVGTYRDHDQAVSRPRDCADFRIWVANQERPAFQSDLAAYQHAVHELKLTGADFAPSAPGKAPKFVPRVVDEYAEVYERILAKERGSLQRLQGLFGEQQTALTKGHHLWAKLYALIRGTEAWGQANKRADLTQHRRELGSTIVPVPVDEPTAKAMAAQLNLYREDPRELAQAIFDAGELTEPEAERLQRKRVRSKDEQLQLDRWRLQRVLKADFNVEKILEALEVDLLLQLHRLKTHELLTDQERGELDQGDRRRNQAAFTSNRHRVAQRELLTYLTDAAQVDVPGLRAAAAQGLEPEVSPQTLAAVAAAYAKRQRELNNYFDARISKPHANAKKCWEATFGKHLALPLRTVVVSKKPFVSQHFVDARLAALANEKFNELDAE